MRRNQEAVTNDVKYDHVESRCHELSCVVARVIVALLAYERSWMELYVALRKPDDCLGSSSKIETNVTRGIESMNNETRNSRLRNYIPQG